MLKAIMQKDTMQKDKMQKNTMKEDTMKKETVPKIISPVYFIGAGPGDPELITVKGKRLIEDADLIIYAGSLVNPQLLEGLRAELVIAAHFRWNKPLNWYCRPWQRERKW